MTVIAAVARQGRVVMAADTVTNYADTIVYGARKIRRLPVYTSPAATVVGERVLLAAVGHGAIPAVLERLLHIDGAPAITADWSAVQSWADTVAAAATEVLAEQTPPLLCTNSDESRTINGALLLGWRGHLFYLFTHQAQYVPDGIAALGSGADVALGVLHTIPLADPEEAVRAAVGLACLLNPYCRVDQRGPLVEHLPETGDT